MQQQQDSVTLRRMWLMWLITAFFYGFEYFLQVSPSVMFDELRKAFQVNATQLGNLSGIYFYAYAAMQIPVGILYDRFGVRRLLSTAVLCCAVGAYLFGAAESFWIAQVGRLLIGLGSSFAIVGCMTVAATWFAPRYFALFTGITVTIGMLGAAGGQSLLSQIVEHVDWRSTNYGFAIVALIISFSMFLILKDKAIVTVNKIEEANLLTGLRYVLSHKKNWLLALWGGLMFAPTSALGALWGISFLMTRYSITRPEAGQMMAIVFFGWMIGSPFFGWLTDYLGKRKSSLYISALVCFIVSCFMVYFTLPKYIMCTLLFAFGLFSSGFLPSFTIIKEITPMQFKSTALGFMNTLNMVGGAIVIPFIGFILDYTWSGNLSEGQRVYSLNEYVFGMSVIPAFFFIAFCLLPFLPETYCKQKS